MVAIKKQSLLFIIILFIVIVIGCSASKPTNTISTQQIPDTIPDTIIANPINVTPIDTVMIDLNGSDHSFQIYQVDDYEISIPVSWSISQVRELEIKTEPKQGSKGKLIGIRSNPGGEGCISICHELETNDAMTIIMREFLKPIGIDVLNVEYNGRVKRASTNWIDWYWVVSFTGNYEGNNVHGDYFITDFLRDSLFKSYSFLIIKPSGTNTDNAQFEILVDFVLSSFKPIT
jgi:hypothetical protein